MATTARECDTLQYANRSNSKRHHMIVYLLCAGRLAGLLQVVKRPSEFVLTFLFV
jgi:hypothetical protein